MASSSVSNESSDNSLSEVPADSSSGLGFWFLVNSASLGTLSGSSDDSGSLPGTLPCALGPDSLTSSEGLASLTLSHPDSGNSTLLDSSSEASGESSTASSVSSTSSVSSSPSSQESSTSHVVLSSEGTSSECSSSSSEDTASSSVSSSESLNKSGTSTCGEASGHLTVALLVDSAHLASLVLVLLDNRSSEWGADLSGSLW